MEVVAAVVAKRGLELEKEAVCLNGGDDSLEGKRRELRFGGGREFMVVVFMQERKEG